jgi:hypothetical protein
MNACTPAVYANSARQSGRAGAGVSPVGWSVVFDIAPPSSSAVIGRDD